MVELSTLKGMAEQIDSDAKKAPTGRDINGQLGRKSRDMKIALLLEQANQSADKDAYLDKAFADARDIVTKNQADLAKLKSYRLEGKTAEEGQLFHNNSDLVKARAALVLGTGIAQSGRTVSAEDKKLFLDLVDNDVSTNKVIASISQKIKEKESEKKIAPISDAMLTVVHDELKSIKAYLTKPLEKVRRGDEQKKQGAAAKNKKGGKGARTDIPPEVQQAREQAESALGATAETASQALDTAKEQGAAALGTAQVKGAEAVEAAKTNGAAALEAGKENAIAAQKAAQEKLAETEKLAKEKALAAQKLAQEKLAEAQKLAQEKADAAKKNFIGFFHKDSPVQANGNGLPDDINAFFGIGVVENVGPANPMRFYGTVNGNHARKAGLKLNTLQPGLFAALDMKPEDILVSMGGPTATRTQISDTKSLKTGIDTVFNDFKPGQTKEVVFEINRNSGGISKAVQTHYVYAYLTMDNDKKVTITKAARYALHTYDYTTKEYWIPEWKTPNWSDSDVH